MELSSPKLKNFSYLFYISGENFLSSKNKQTYSEKKLLYFEKLNFLDPSLKSTDIFSKTFFPCISGRNFLNLKNKNF